ncbi:ATPase [Nocardia sp. Root136]|uniref:cell division protein ZapE n=1 Tax=Nocardia sp. Root136 TaxID=1736458 RepID=UPI000700955E|nr:cell division protein ZapE [Nocardia sp. Root136]KQY33566.1 ATPase [Nocardia sp. Root136]
MKPDTVVLDPAQQAALRALESLLDPGRPLGARRPAERGDRRTGWFGIPLTRPVGRGNAGRPEQPADLRTDRSGVYLHGRPGRGKTMVMDRFFASVDTERKRRFHFHAFFASLHAATHALGSIERAIGELLGDADLVCFDEFHVTDIGDAMLVARMLDTLFAERRTLVVTSNYRPEDLLPNPLFHDHFLPTIGRILANLDTVTLDGPLDYRTRTAHRDTGFLAGRYVVTADIGSAFPRVDVPIGNGRTLRAHATADAITVGFHDICAAPTSAADYLCLADRYRHWTLREVPPLREVSPDWAMRLVNLVDVLYDADLPFTVHAPEPPHELTAGVPAIPDLARTASRLGELPLTGELNVRTA